MLRRTFRASLEDSLCLMSPDYRRIQAKRETLKHSPLWGVKALITLLLLIGCGEDSQNIIAPAIEDIAAAAPGKLTPWPPVKIYYFDMEGKPSTRPGGATYEAHRRRITEVTVSARRWYSHQMRQHGYGGMSFKLPRSGGDGQLPITYLRAKHRKADYLGERGDIAKEVSSHFDDSRGIRLVFMNAPSGVCGFGKTWNTWDTDASVFLYGGKAFIHMDGCGLVTVCHELGHAFGLHHDFRRGDYIMSYGNERKRLSDGAAAWLSRHPAFKRQRVGHSRLDSVFWITRMSAVQRGNSRNHIVTITGFTAWLGKPLPKGDIPAPLGVLLKPSTGHLSNYDEVLCFINPKHFTYAIGETRSIPNYLGFTTKTSLTFTVKFPMKLPAGLTTVSVDNITGKGFYAQMPRSDTFTKRGTTLEWGWEN